ncbi:rhotekin-2 isoform X4 [Taeniopygia guttata]|uniref:rhotekin-2 isoform X4 n=1 Tax=Taeniopygia guttata TaxID=59729 RepID=UPI003BB892EC
MRRGGDAGGGAAGGRGWVAAADGGTTSVPSPERPPPGRPAVSTWPGAFAGSCHSKAECDTQEKINFEVRMREGICRLLAVSTQREQLLRAVKDLMVCNARIRAYRAQLQGPKEPSPGRAEERSSENETKDRMACRAKVAISDIRIPLMWKGSDHFSKKEKSQRYAVFCLFRMGAEVFDTEVIIVDEAITDICFENVTIFDEASPDFQVKVEVYSCCTEESLYITNTPKKLAKKLKTSLSKATGKKLKAALEEDSTEPLVPADPVIHGAKYSLLAYTTLGLESAEDNFRTHNLTITGNEESSFWLPLYGNMCCRLVVQPSCMARDMMAGFLNQQQMVGGLTSWRRLYCVLRGGKLLCYYSPEEIEDKVEPALTVSINKETRIRAVDKDSKRRCNTFSVINPVSGEGVTQRFAADSRDELHQWMEAFWQHFYDLSQWKHCCEELMKIEIMSPRKPPLFLTKEATSVYHDMSIDSPVKPEGLADIIHRKIEESNGEFLPGQQQESASALWASLFDGSHEMAVQKNMHLDPKRDTASPNDSRGKKRRAPPPPSDKSPCSAEAQVNTEPLGKENWRKPDHTPASGSSLESVLATKTQQLQTPIAPPRKIGPCGRSGLAGLRNPISLVSKTKSETKPVPTPRHKGITEILDPRSWLHP